MDGHSVDGHLWAFFVAATEMDAAGNIAEAERLCRSILGVDPVHAHANHLLGLIAMRRHDLDSAETFVRRAEKSAPGTTLFRRSLVELARRRQRYDEALRLARLLVADEPAEPLNLVFEATVLRQINQPEAALEVLDRAVALGPNLAEAHFERGYCQLLLGRFAQGWEEHEWRFRIGGATPTLTPANTPPWTGGRLDGPLLLVADQGFGDVIQFARYIPWARGHATDVTVFANLGVSAILRRMYPDLAVTTAFEDVPGFAGWSPLSGLPRLHGTTAATIPASVPYYVPDPAAVASWQQRLAAITPPGHRRIGVVWAGRPDHANDANRSATPALFAGLAQHPVLLVSLQQGAAAAAAHAWPGPAPLLPLGPTLVDLDDTAAVIACLDLVVTVDTAVAHLAGAMGQQVWIALPFAPEWRWQIGAQRHAVVSDRPAVPPAPARPVGRCRRSAG